MTRLRFSHGVILAAAFAAGAAHAEPQTGPATPATAPVATTPDAAAPKPDLAYAAFQRGYYVTAMKEAMARIAADSRDAPAMTLMGEIYKDGYAVKRDDVEAVRWYQLASNLGDRQATFALAVAYLQGTGVAKDRAKAKALFEKAAAQNHAGALFNLGIMSVEGEIKDFRAAANFFRRASDAGDLDATFALATLYRSGNGVEKDPAKAAELLRRAADQRNLDALVEYGIILFNGDGVPKDEAAAARSFLKAAARDNPVAQNRLARILATGRGMPRNMIEAMKWHLLARDKGLADPWLDQQLATLTPAERSSVEETLRKYVGK